jgi:uncharacterized protein (DUF849 family)
MHPKVVITCAITGNLTRPDQTPYLPITPEQIANSALVTRAREIVERMGAQVANPEQARTLLGLA